MTKYELDIECNFSTKTLQENIQELLKLNTFESIITTIFKYIPHF